MGLRSPHHRHTPRRRGIQYAASSRFNHGLLGILDARLRGHDKVDMSPRSRDTLRPSFANSFTLKMRGRREDRVRAAPAVSCANAYAKENAHEHTGSAEAVRPSLRNGFTAYIVLSPARPGLLVTVVPKKRELLANLTPAIGASGPHDFAVRVTRPSSKAQSASTAPRPNVSDDGQRPLSRDGMARNKQVIWVGSQGQFRKIRNGGDVRG